MMINKKSNSIISLTVDEIALPCGGMLGELVVRAKIFIKNSMADGGWVVARRLGCGALCTGAVKIARKTQKHNTLESLSELRKACIDVCNGVLKYEDHIKHPAKCE